MLHDAHSQCPGCTFIIKTPNLCCFHACFLQHCCLICGHLGARFGFVLDEELKEAASCDEVKDALAAKISRERIGVEVCVLSCILK